ncbi:MAG: nucleotidyl transferase AbiEii/AbiGii toxin family protein [Candidatus Altiarchaeota archaeon]
MLSESELRRIAQKNQATELNTAREYAQHLFLNYLGQTEESKKMLFKGGTALRIVYGSPRFSEDLDYTLLDNNIGVKKTIEEALTGMRSEGFDISSEFHTTSGGWLILAATQVHSLPVRIELNLSNRRKTTPHPQFHMIHSQYAPAYTLTALSETQLVEEKIQALLSRKKPRDYYDLYFIIRAGLDKKPAIENRSRLLEAVDEIKEAKLKPELKTFLPPTHWQTVTNLKNNLKKELTRL